MWVEKCALGRTGLQLSRSTRSAGPCSLILSLLPKCIGIGAHLMWIPFLGIMLGIDTLRNRLLQIGLGIMLSRLTIPVQVGVLGTDRCISTDMVPVVLGAGGRL